VAWMLPPELVVRIFEFLSPQNLGIAALVSVQWYQLTKSGSLWHVQYKNAYNVTWRIGKFTDWREKYIEVHNKFKLLKKGKANLQAHYQQHKELKHYEMALGALNDTIEEQKREKKRIYDFLYQRALLYRDMNKKKLAEADIREIIKAQPNNESMWRQLGNWAKEEANTELAMEYYYKSLEVKPSLYTYLCLSYLYLDLENFVKALQYVEIALAMSPEDSECYCLRGRIYHFTGRTKLALSDFNKAIESSPSNSLYYHFRGRILREMNEMKKALADFNKAIALTGDNIDHAYRALIYWHFRDYKAAMKDINSSIDKDGGFPSHYQSRGVMLYGAGAFEESYLDFTKAISLQPQNAGYYVWRAAITLEREKYEESMQDLDKAVTMRADETSLFWRGLLHLTIGEKTKARYDIQEANKVSRKKTSRILFWLGIILYVTNKKKEGDELLRDCLEVAKAEPEIRPSRYAQPAHVALLREDSKSGKQYLQEMVNSHCTADNLRAESAHLRVLCKLFPENNSLKETHGWFATVLAKEEQLFHR